MQTATTIHLIDKKELVKEIIKPARQKKRFYTYLVDGIFFYVLVILLSIIAGVVPTLFGVRIDATSSSIGPLTDYLIFMFLYVLYYIGFEGFVGKTIGKMVTNTKVVKLDGSKPSFSSIIGRSFARIIPFEAFSFLVLARGWHDMLSGTMVVDDIDLYNINSPKVMAETADFEY